jgi:hypothetical protein
MQPEWSPDDFFGGLETPRVLFEAVQARLVPLGDTTTRATKSQLGFHRRREFASVWTWDACVLGHQAPLVVTIVLPRHDASPRWTHVVEQAPGCFAHDLELWVPDDVDAQLAAWLAEAWAAAA